MSLLPFLRGRIEGRKQDGDRSNRKRILAAGPSAAGAPCRRIVAGVDARDVIDQPRDAVVEIAFVPENIVAVAKVAESVAVGTGG